MVDSSTVWYFAVITVVLTAAQYFMSAEPRQRRQTRAVPTHMVAAVSAVLPTVDPEIIRADLQQTQNAQATIERLLANPPPDSPAAATGTAGPATAGAASTRKNSSLLGRYQLEGDESVPSTSSGWKDSRQEREAQLKATREAMILNARNKLKNT